MSGLEPIAALSLACNILQVVGTGREAVRLIRQVYRDGTIDPALKENASALEELSTRILPSTTATSSSVSSTPQDTQLVSLATKCQGAARDLQEEFNFLNWPPSKAKLVATVKIAAKTTWRKRRLDWLDQRLKEAESTLQTGLLTRIYERSLKMANGLLTLDADCQAFITEYRNGYADIASLTRKYITTESKRSEEAVKSHVTEKTYQAEDSLKEHIGLAFRGMVKQGQDAQVDAKRHRLLQSLKFHRMNERRNLIGSSNPRTFTWILEDGSEGDEFQRPGRTPDRGNDALESWDSFSDWLRSTGTVYWISGKPGSGKSSLINYLLSQPRLHKYLDLWRHDSMVISHFFWRPGTIMQQSIRGLLCSLLYQLLLGDNEIVDQVLIKYDRNSHKDTETDWSGEELQSALHDVMSHYQRPIAIFLDGLDEVLPRDGVLSLLEVVNKIKELHGPAGKVKLCLGSRREPLLCKRLGIYPQLRLEQLNRIDLQHYGNSNIIIPTDYHITMSTNYKLFHRDYVFCQGRLPSRTELKEWLVDSLVDKAEGVFLWLCLTVATVTKALHEGEMVEDLNHRIESLPGELADLYEDMWARMNHSNHFKVQAASYLQLALAYTEDTDFDVILNPFTMMVATTPEMADQLLRPGPSNHISVASLIEACEKTTREVLSRCAGLVICPDIGTRTIEDEEMIPWCVEEYSSLIPYVSESPTYSFLHRTARDFLADTEAGQTILSLGSFADCRAYTQLLRGHLAIYRLFKMPWTSRNEYCIKLHDDMNRVWVFFLRMQWIIQRQALQFRNSEHDGSARIEISRLLLICEQLFNDGYLCGTPTIPPKDTRFEQIPLNVRYYIYPEITVNRRDEFLIEAVSNSLFAPDLWKYILPIIESRSVDTKTLSQILVQACCFSQDLESLLEEVSDTRLEAIETLLGWGASARCEACRRIKLLGNHGICDIMTSETPFRTFMMSVWDVATNFSIDQSRREKLLSLIGLFVDHGADLREEVYIAIEVEGGLIEFRDLWGEFKNFDTVKPSTPSPDEAVYSPKERIHVVIIMAYPASAIIAKAIKTWQLEPFLQMNLPPEAKEMARSDGGKGHAIALVDVSELKYYIKRIQLVPALFLGDIFPLRSQDSLDDGLQELVRLAESGFHDAVLKKDHAARGARGVFSHVLVPSEVQERAAYALEQLRSTDVPAMERRREVRRRLGVCTPLEEEEWQQHTIYYDESNSGTEWWNTSSEDGEMSLEEGFQG